MPKLNGRPPKYCHHKASDRGCVKIAGREIYLGAYDCPESWEQYHRLINACSPTAGACRTSMRRIRGRSRIPLAACDAGC